MQEVGDARSARDFCHVAAKGVRVDMNPPGFGPTLVANGMLGACRLSPRPVARSSFLRRLLAAAPMKSVPEFSPVPLRHQLAFQGFVLPAAAVVSRTVMDQLRGEHRQARRVISNELSGASYIVFECGTAPTEPRHITRSRMFLRHFSRNKMPSSERNRFHATS